METFWENVVDILILVIKATIFLAFIRLVLFVFDVTIYIPVLDDILLSIGYFFKGLARDLAIF